MTALASEPEEVEAAALAWDPETGPVNSVPTGSPKELVEVVMPYTVSPSREAMSTKTYGQSIFGRRPQFVRAHGPNPGSGGMGIMHPEATGSGKLMAELGVKNEYGTEILIFFLGQ